MNFVGLRLPRNMPVVRGVTFLNPNLPPQKTRVFWDFVHWQSGLTVSKHPPPSISLETCARISGFFCVQKANAHLLSDFYVLSKKLLKNDTKTPGTDSLWIEWGIFRTVYSICRALYKSHSPKGKTRLKSHAKYCTKIKPDVYRNECFYSILLTKTFLSRETVFFGSLRKRHRTHLIRLRAALTTCVRRWLLYPRMLSVMSKVK